MLLAMFNHRRPRLPWDKVWALIALVLLVTYLEKSDVSQAVIEERRAQIEQPGRLSHPLPCDATMRVMVGPVVLSEECYRRPQQ